VLLDRLAAVGVRPDEIDTVLLTHLHPDHVGAAIDHESGNGGGPAYPRARYLVHRAEWEAWRRPEVQEAFPPPFFDQLVGPLERLGALELVDDGHRVSRSVTAIHTPATRPPASAR